MILAVLMVLTLMMPMSAMAWTEIGYETPQGTAGSAKINFSLTKETTFFGTDYYGCFIAKQFFYTSSLRMQKFITSIDTHCYNGTNNRHYTNTNTNVNTGSCRTKSVYNGYDDTNIKSFGLTYEFQSTTFGSDIIERTVLTSEV